MNLGPNLDTPTELRQRKFYHGLHCPEENVWPKDWKLTGVPPLVEVSNMQIHTFVDNLTTSYSPYQCLFSPIIPLCSASSTQLSKS